MGPKFLAGVCLCLLIACGKDRASDRDEFKQRTLSYLNDQNYSQAILLLESRAFHQLDQEGMIKLLIDSYLGFCQLDAHELHKISDRMDEKYSESLEDEKNIENLAKEIPKVDQKCPGYIKKSIQLSEVYSVEITRDLDREFYLGNLYILDSLFLVQDLYESIEGVEEERERELRLIGQGQVFFKIEDNFKKSLERYHKSYQELRPITILLERVLKWKEELF